jgi:hypothetical protein
MNEGQSNTLYDEVHAIMLKELLTFFKENLNDLESEVPYSFYGNRGSVDLVEYGTINILGISHQYLGMYELESRILRLEELIRKLKDRMEYFPRCFEKERGLPKLGAIHLFLVLLGTIENWKVVDKYLLNFKSAFTRINKIFPTDILSKTREPSNDDFYAQIKRVWLIFFDPLKVRQLDTSVELFLRKGDRPFHRSSAFRYLESWSDSIDDLQSELKLIKPRFSDAKEFLQAYQRYVSS